MRFRPDGVRYAVAESAAIGGIRVVPAAGGTATRVATGTSVAWGGGDIPSVFRRLKATGRTGRIRVAVRSAVEGSAVLIEVCKGRKRLARDRTARLLDGDELTTTFTGPKLRGRLNVRVTVTAPGARPERRTVIIRA